MAGQGSYESDAAAVKGGRVVLRDFDNEREIVPANN